MATSKVVTQKDLQNILAHVNLGDDSHTEITQAAFNILPDSEKNDGTIYFITDGSNKNIFLDDNTPIGMIAPYGGTVDPAYWLICDGRAINRTTYSELFSVIGTTYGEGDGETTFNIPDLRGNVAVGASEDYILGNVGGESEHILNINEMPEHGHKGVRWGSPTGLEWSDAGSARSGYPNTLGGGNIAAGSWYAGNTGGSQAHNNMQPYIVTNYIIKAQSAISQNQSHMDMFYPIGSYYETTNPNFNPTLKWGGTWELIDEYELVAWVSVTNNIITASHNMSVTGLGGTAYYTISFIHPMADTDYLVSASGEASGIGAEILGVYQKTTNGFYFDHANNAGTAVALPYFTITVFGKLAQPEKFKWHRIA